MQAHDTKSPGNKIGMRGFFIAVAVLLILSATLSIYFLKPPGSDEAVRPLSPSDTASQRPLRPDTEADAIDYEELTSRGTPVPKVSRAYRIGVMVKFLGNPFWKKMADGMQAKAAELGLAVEVRAALSEDDLQGQLRLMEEMVTAQDPYDLFLVSPQTGQNLIPAVERAEQMGIPVINVDGAVLDNAKYWVGAPNYQKGVLAADYVLSRFPKGCKVAVIMGRRGIYDAQQRTKGFLDTLEKSGKPFPVAGTPHCDWDLQKAFETTVTLFEDHADIEAVYCNNDNMALGVVGALKTHHKGKQVVVVGTDGIGEAYASIRRGELTATIDPAPDVAGAIAVEVALRVLEGQTVPRAVYAPQKLIDKSKLSD